MSSNESFAAISARGGRAHSCALTTAGRILCWGYNDAGQLGNGTTLRQQLPAPVATGLTFTGVSAGGDLAEDGFTCAIATDGYAWCWGRNHAGQLGDATRANRATPVRVAH